MARTLAYHAFVQQCAASALDEPQAGIRFISAVNRQIERPFFGQHVTHSQHVAVLLQEKACTEGCRDAHDIVPLIRRHQLRQTVDNIFDGGAAADANHHAVPHDPVIHRLVGRALLAEINVAVRPADALGHRDTGIVMLWDPGSAPGGDAAVDIIEGVVSVVELTDNCKDLGLVVDAVKLVRVVQLRTGEAEALALGDVEVGLVQSVFRPEVAVEYHRLREVAADLLRVGRRHRELRDLGARPGGTWSVDDTAIAGEHQDILAHGVAEELRLKLAEEVWRLVPIQPRGDAQRVLGCLGPAPEHCQGQHVVYVVLVTRLFLEDVDGLQQLFLAVIAEVCANICGLHRPRPATRCHHELPLRELTAQECDLLILLGVAQHRVAAHNADLLLSCVLLSQQVEYHAVVQSHHDVVIGIVIEVLVPIVDVRVVVKKLLRRIEITSPDPERYVACRLHHNSAAAQQVRLRDALGKVLDADEDLPVGALEQRLCALL